MSSPPLIIIDKGIKKIGADGTTTYKQYRRGDYLGKGASSRVYELTSIDTGTTYAVKIIPKASITKPSIKKRLINEIGIQQTLDHPHVVKLSRYFEDDVNIYIILNLSPHQSLKELIDRRKYISENEARPLVWQLLSALTYLHGTRVVHRDIKLGNLLFDADYNLQVADFGLAIRFDNDTDTDTAIVGTPNYISPEMLDSKPYSFSVDIWAVGIVMYTLLVGTPPFETASIRTTYQRIRENEWSFPDKPVLSEEARQLITDILKTDPLQRPSLVEIKNSPWFTTQPHAYTFQPV